MSIPSHNYICMCLGCRRDYHIDILELVEDYRRVDISYRTKLFHLEVCLVYFHIYIRMFLDQRPLAIHNLELLHIFRYMLFHPIHDRHYNLLLVVACSLDIGSCMYLNPIPVVMYIL